MATTTPMTRNEKTAYVLLAIVALLSFVQVKIPDFPGITEHGITVATTIVMFIVSSLTLIRQYLSQEIADAAMKLGWLTLIASILELAIDLTGAFNLSELLQQQIRFWIIMITGAINLLSKFMFPVPTAETRMKI